MVERGRRLGVLVSPEVPGEVFAHFAHIDAVGYRSLSDGDRVNFEWEHYRPGQATSIGRPGLSADAADLRFRIDRAAVRLALR